MNNFTINDFNIFSAHAFEKYDSLGFSKFEYIEAGAPWNDQSDLFLDEATSEQYKSASEDFIICPKVWPRRLLKTDDLMVLGPRCMLLSARHKSLITGYPLNWHWPHLESDFNNFTKQDLGGLVFFQEAIVLPTPGFRVYGHWLLDFLPRLLLTFDFFKSIGREMPIVSRFVPPWAKKFIEYSGLGGIVKEYDNNVPFHIENAYLPLVPKDGMFYSSACLKECFAVINSKVAPAPSENYTDQSKILILRNKEPSASNQAELREALEPLGFKAVFPEKLSFDDQVRLFRNAQLVVGEDGSAMHGIGFCQPTTRVVIWGRGNRMNVRHLSVARASGAEMTLIDSLGDDLNYRIDLDRVLEVVAR